VDERDLDPDDVAVAYVNREISQDQFFRWICEHEGWLVQSQQLPNGAIIPLISEEDGVGTVRMFSDEPAVQRWLEQGPPVPPRPYKTVSGAGVLGAMPPAVQQVVFNPGGRITLRVPPDGVVDLRTMGSAVLVERMLRAKSPDAGEYFRTLLQHRDYCILTDLEGRLLTEVIPDHGRMQLAFTHLDCAEAYVEDHPELIVREQVVRGPALFERLAEAPSDIVASVFNPAGPGLRTAMRPHQIRQLADVVFVE
jgi:hypothetical protein